MNLIVQALVVQRRTGDQHRLQEIRTRRIVGSGPFDRQFSSSLGFFLVQPDAEEIAEHRGVSKG